ncbi:MAG: hypothetical protein KIS77_17680 [Saprospiraceae bacterium]|nr:hypothetical protein [Saprospiraceae bacterium]
MNKTTHIEPLSPRAGLLAQPVFFQKKFIFEKIVFAEMCVGENARHDVAVHLGKKLFRCSCLFQPKPCIHAQALYLLFEREGEQAFVPTVQLPEWAGTLLEGATATPLKNAAAEVSAHQQQRRLERLERAANGMDDLEAWLLDTARRSLATVVSEHPQWYEGIAARMADASMTGLSRTLRLLAQVPASAPDWAEQMSATLASCYLAVRAFRNRATMPEALLHDLQNFIGIHHKKEEVLANGERVHDVWVVLGQVEEPLEEQLMERRTWLLGSTTKRHALLLEFAFGGGGFPAGLQPGSFEQGTLAFYPSAYPLRVLAVGDFVRLEKKMETLAGFEDFDAFMRVYAAALAAQPWLQIFPAAFSAVVALKQGDAFFIVDNRGKLLRLQVKGNEGWRLLALSGGQAVGLFGEWNGAALRPLCAVAEGRFVRLGLEGFKK